MRPLLAQAPEGAPITLDRIEGALDQVVQTLSIAGVLIAVIFIILAGVRWMTAGADQKQVDQAKGMLKSAVIGAAVVLGVGLILSTVANFFE